MDTNGITVIAEAVDTSEPIIKAFNSGKSIKYNVKGSKYWHTINNKIGFDYKFDFINYNYAMTSN